MMLSLQPRLVVALLLAVATVGAAPGLPAQAPAQGPAGATRLDHVIIGGASLESLAAEFERRTGVKPALGGRHPGRGTRNALVRLGDRTYLELIAPVPDSANAEVKALYAPMITPTLLGFAIGTAALSTTITRLAAGGLPAGPIGPGARQTPSGARLAWRTAALPSIGTAWAPFLIEWSDDSPHPATNSPDGCTLVSLSVQTPASYPAGALAGVLTGRVSVTRGSAGSLALVLQCPKGRVTF